MPSFFIVEYVRRGLGDFKDSLLCGENSSSAFVFWPTVDILHNPVPVPFGFLEEAALNLDPNEFGRWYRNDQQVNLACQHGIVMCVSARLF